MSWRIAIIAPDRKQDPGELFPWARLASHGIGLWAACDGSDVSATEDDLRPDLAALGFDMLDLSPARLEIMLRAFQRHWRQEVVSGHADRGTAARLNALVEMIVASGMITDRRPAMPASAACGAVLVGEALKR